MTILNSERTTATLPRKSMFLCEPSQKAGGLSMLGKVILTLSLCLSVIDALLLIYLLEVVK
jgi:hypothetical protein